MTDNGCATHQGFRLAVTIIYAILAASLLVWQGLTFTSPNNKGDELSMRRAGQLPDFTTTHTGTTTSIGLNAANPLAIPQGQAQNLPSVRVEDTSDVDNKRDIYGGAGDKAHLGGFTELDMHGISPKVWKGMIETYGVHSVLDVGCGRGVSTSWFKLHGADVLCAEGSHDAVERSMLPRESIVEHDFSRGPWWPGKTYDAVWAVEFLEHVGVNYHFNYISAFRKAAILFVSSSRWGGWHHVEVHSDEWWIRKYESYGFKFDPVLTDQVRQWAREEGMKKELGPTGKPYRAQHISLSMKVFINPAVAALPEHAHLFFEHGCYLGRGTGADAGKLLGRPCRTGKGKEAQLESVLPPSFWPLNLTEDMDRKWEELIRSKVSVPEKSK